MKHTSIKSLSGICLLALGLCACSKTAETINSGFPQDGVVRISTGTCAPLTKAAGDVSAYSGDSLGFFIWYGDGSDRCTKRNVKWTKDASTGEWTPDALVVWKNETDTPHIWAYAPYNDMQKYISTVDECGTVIFAIPANQSAGTEAADLVGWGIKNYVPDHSVNENFSEDGKIIVSFSHMLVKLTIDFVIRSQFDSDVTISKVVLKGTTAKVSFNLYDPDATRATADSQNRDITFHKVNDLRYEGVFFPGPGQEPGAKMLEVKMSDGTVLSYTISSSGLFYGSDKFESGYAYTMQMYLGRNKIELNQISLEEWMSSNIEIDGGDATETII
ncbi:MAG: fimbrillin family protein [Candidatus Cryptobacteroides sp.]